MLFLWQGKRMRVRRPLYSFSRFAHHFLRCPLQLSELLPSIFYMCACVFPPQVVFKKFLFFCGLLFSFLFPSSSLPFRFKSTGINPDAFLTRTWCITASHWWAAVESYFCQLQLVGACKKNLLCIELFGKTGELISFVSGFYLVRVVESKLLSLAPLFFVRSSLCLFQLKWNGSVASSLGLLSPFFSSLIADPRWCWELCFWRLVVVVFLSSQ